MSGRQVKRLLKERLPQAPISEEEEDSQSDEELPETSKSAFNPFALLTDDEDEGASDEDESDSIDPHSPSSSDNERTSTNQTSSTKQHTAAENSRKQSQPPSAAQRQKCQRTRGQEAEEDLDAILKELNITPAAPSPLPSGSGSALEPPLLAVDTRHLKPDEELRRMFGSSAVQAASEGDDRGSDPALAGASRRVRRLAARGLLVRHRLKPGVLSMPRDGWPPFHIDRGMEMQQISPGPDAKPRWKYVYSAAYQAAQALYEECQATFDPNAVAAVLNVHPWHADTLLTMADTYRHMGENSYADEMVDRCIYALEAAWPPGFASALASGNARLLRDEASQPLFQALFRRIQSLGRRGLHRTALETCKLLLQLDPEDSMGVRMTIDYFAVRAGEYRFLERLAQGLGADGEAVGDVALLPNVPYSLALGKWYREQEESAGGSGISAKSKPKTHKHADRKRVLSDVAAREEASSNAATSSLDALTKAIALHPLVLVQLQAKISQQTSMSPVWTTLLAAPLFANASDGGSPGLSHLVDIFVERQHLLWKAAAVQEWLLEAAHRAAADDPLDMPDGLTAADWAAVRRQAFPASTTNEYGHLRLYEFSDAVVRLPPEAIHGMHGNAGAVGRDDEEMRQHGREFAARLEAALEAGDVELQREVTRLAATNPLFAFLRSLLPWTGVQGQQPDYDAEGRDAGHVPGDQQTDEDEAE